MRARKMLNLLVLLTMALGLFAAPTVSADPESPVAQKAGMWIDPPNAKSYAHYVLVYQLNTDLPQGMSLITWWRPDGVDQGFNEDELTDWAWANALPGDPEYVSLSYALPGSMTDPSGFINPADLSEIPAVAVETTHPDYILTWKESPWLEQDTWEVQFSSQFTPKLGTGHWIRIDIWGPPSINPGEQDAGLSNPDRAGEDVCVHLGSDDERGPWPGEGMEGGTNRAQACHPISPPMKVRLFRKFQIPYANCNYTYLQEIAGFETIIEALSAADQVWANIGDYEDEAGWNLYGNAQGMCPNLSELTVGAGELESDEPINAYAGEILGQAQVGVAVGAVIVVDPGNYAGPLAMDTPGVILGSSAGPMSTTIQVESVDAFNAIPVDQQRFHDAVVDISAGAITFGESTIKTGSADGSEAYLNLYGFDVEVTRVVTPLESVDVVYVNPQGEKTQDDYSKIMDPVVDGYGLLDATNFSIYMDSDPNTLVFTNTSASLNSSVLLQNLEGNTAWDTLDDDNKLVNLTTGWSGHMDVVTCGDVGVTYGDICIQLYATDDSDYTFEGAAQNNYIDVMDTYFKDGDSIAVFAFTGDEPSVQTARVDVRGNWIHGGTKNGVAAYTTAIWVDSNDVYENDMDGFFGADLFCQHSWFCDGAMRTDNALEFSHNAFYDNGLGGEWGCGSLAGEFNPDGWGDDSGIHIYNTMASEVPCAHLYIHDNWIEANADAGIWLGWDSARCGARILRNDIVSNGVFGVSSWAQDNTYSWDKNPESDFFEPVRNEADVIFKYNNVVDNGMWGVKNWAFDYNEDRTLNAEFGPMFNAKENYWNYCEGGVPPGSPVDSCDPGGPAAGPVPCGHKYDQRGHGLGYGDAVDKGTYYNPWLAIEWQDLLDVETQGMRAYGSDSLKLQPGWNTLAVPIGLDNSYDEVAEILDLGTFLKTADGEELVERLYEFDNTGMGWQQHPEIEAVHGYYIKIDPDLAPEGTRFPVIYNTTSPGLPYYNLKNNDTTNGWNLVGSGFGIDKTWETVTTTLGAGSCDPDMCTWTCDSWYQPPEGQPQCEHWTVECPAGCSGWVFANSLDQGRYAVADPDGERDGEAVKWAGEVLESVVWGDNFSNGASLVVNPGVPGQLMPFWARTIQNIFGDTTNPAWMFTGEAYWVFMREDATLAGFEMTPLYLDYEPFPIPLW